MSISVELLDYIKTEKQKILDERLFLPDNIMKNYDTIFLIKQSNYSIHRKTMCDNHNKVKIMTSNEYTTEIYMILKSELTDLTMRHTIFNDISNEFLFHSIVSALFESQTNKYIEYCNAYENLNIILHISDTIFTFKGGNRMKYYYDFLITQNIKHIMNIFLKVIMIIQYILTQDLLYLMKIGLKYIIKLI